MTDVRLTALNPEDSKVYPVACNSSGELLTTKGTDINLDVPGNLDVGGAITAEGSTTFGGPLTVLDNVKAPKFETSSYISSGTGAYIDGISGDATFTGTIKGGGDATFGKGVNTADATTWGVEIDVTANSAGVTTQCTELASPYTELYRAYKGATKVFSVNATGYVFSTGPATFWGDVIVGSRGAKWLIRESNGVAMLVEQTRRGAKEPRIEKEVRDLPRELDLVEAALSEIMGKLEMTPPAGWPVWDGSDNSE